MAIPTYQQFLLPLLNSLRDRQIKKLKEVTEELKSKVRLTEEEKNEMLPSGKDKIADNRIRWAILYLKKAVLINSPEKGIFHITPRGEKVLKSSVKNIDVKFLKQYKEFNEFYYDNKRKKSYDEIEKTKDKTPDEFIEQGYSEKYNVLADALIEKLRSNSPEFFEKVVLDLLIKMGYGEGKTTGKTGDGGIDGVINQDALGLEKVCFQAKRFSDRNTVSSSMLREFVGSLDIYKVSKGVFFTTSKFPKDALKLVSIPQKSIVLIDGPKLVELMIKYDLGVTTIKTYSIKTIDSDYFSET